MRVGDLVRFFSDESDHAGEIGIIVDEELPSKILNESANRKLVQWGNGARCSYPQRQLELINESR